MRSARMLAILIVGLMVSLAMVCKAAPMGTVFTYQGRLIDANNTADGLYDFQFKLYDNNDPCTGTQKGSTIDISDLDVIDGYFTVELDFSSEAFNGDARWLEIIVRQGDSIDVGDYVTLSPRQEVTPTPYALQTRGIFVDDQMNVGIGTTNPYSKLEVRGSRTSPIIKGYNSSGSGVYGVTNATDSFVGVLGEHTDGGIGVLGVGKIGVRGQTTADESVGVWGYAEGASSHAVDGEANGVGSTGVHGESTGFGGEGVRGRATASGGTGVHGIAQGENGIGVYGEASGHAGYFLGDVYASGKVGIGTTDPDGILDVNGPIYQRGGVLHADYVFEDYYELESIDEHSRFMWKNKHLEAIPKAKVDGNGQEVVEVGTHRKGIVEELEKAHIYIEQLHKQNKALEARLVKLEAMIIPTGWPLK